MIQANETRINNWISHNDKYYQIGTIAKEFPTLNTDAFGIGVVDWNNIEPIPLTDKILLKCGFEKEYYGDIDWLEKEFPIIGELCTSDRKNGFYLFDTNTDTLRIYYLHQLQNLYWCLCSKELEINL